MCNQAVCNMSCTLLFVPDQYITGDVQRDNGIKYSLGLKLLTCFRLGLSHLNEHGLIMILRIAQILCSFSLEAESTGHFFLHCNKYVVIRNTLLHELNSIGCDISNCSDPKFSFQQNSDTINTSIEYIINSKRFLCSLL